MQGRAHVGGHITLIFSIQDDADSLLEQGRQNGFVTKIFGRRRPIPELNSQNGQVNSQHGPGNS